MKNINECWQALERCLSIKQAEELVQTFPPVFGSWYIQPKLTGGYTVTNTINTRNLWDQTSQDYDWADVVLKREALLEDKDDTIKVDVNIFDDYNEDAVVSILFEDDKSGTVYEYKMVSEDNEGIIMRRIKI